ncbi:MAG: hypothetical protein C4570_03870 [Ammonifex sp.]|nr:MAG: hypothetical protein C4570_03870 [Ammonifex sp.]
MFTLMMVLATPAFAQEHAQNSQGAQGSAHGASNAPAKKTIDEIRPIPPDEIVKSAEKVGGNVVKLGQGVAKQLVPVSLIAAALLILVGAAVASITKSFLKAGFGVLAGIVVLYLLVFHYDKIVGGFKGLGVGN